MNQNFKISNKYQKEKLLSHVIFSYIYYIYIYIYI